MTALLRSLARTVNRINPTTRGRQFLMATADRISGQRPPSGVYRIAPGVAMDLDTSESLEESLYYYAFEPLCRSILLGHLTRGGVFVDIGANIGCYSLPARRRVGTEGRVIAFEPNPRTLQKLKRNLELNGMEIELFPLALSNREEPVTLYAPQGCHGETSLRNYSRRPVSEMRASAARLDDVFPRDVDRIDFLKIDVEGAEATVFEGGEAVLRRFHPPVLMEVNEEASRAFGAARYDAAKLLLNFHPDYRIYEVTPHQIRRVSMSRLEARGSRNANLLLTDGGPRRT